MVKSPRTGRSWWPQLLNELAARTSALPVSRATGRDRHGVESRIRGLLSGNRLAAKGLRLHRDVCLKGSERISLGQNVTLYGGVYLDASGEKGRIDIGSRTHIDRNSILYGQGGISVGPRCAIAAGVIIYSQSNQFKASSTAPVIDQPLRYAPVAIGEDVWIGAGAIVLPGVTIADHSVIGAGAVVNRDVDEWAIVGGVPARVLGTRRPAALPSDD